MFWGIPYFEHFKYHIVGCTVYLIISTLSPHHIPSYPIIPLLYPNSIPVVSPFYPHHIPILFPYLMAKTMVFQADPRNGSIKTK